MGRTPEITRQRRAHPVIGQVTRWIDTVRGASDGIKTHETRYAFADGWPFAALLPDQLSVVHRVCGGAAATGRWRTADMATRRAASVTNSFPLIDWRAGWWTVGPICRVSPPADRRYTPFGL